MVLWDEVGELVRREYPGVAYDRQHVDAAAMNFVLKPETFDVVVASNLFGDILSDLSGGITGSLGLNPSANLNPTRKFPSLFEPVHGSAPDIAGKGVANPTASFFAAFMMLRHLEVREDLVSTAERCLISCIEEDKLGTSDIGGSLTTEEFSEAFLERLTVALEIY